MVSSSGTIGFVGLDDISLRLAVSFVQAGFQVQAVEFERNGSGLMKKFVEFGGEECGSGMDVARAARALILLIEIDQMDVVFGEEGIVKGLQKETVIIIRSVIPPDAIMKLEKQLLEEVGVIVLLDTHIFRGVTDEFNEKLIVCASGKQETMEIASPLLSVMGAKLYIFEGEIAASSKVKMVNELLVGIHLAAAVEAMFLGSRAGIHPLIIYNIISNAAGTSRVFVDFIPKLLNGDISLKHHLHVLIKKLESVMDVAKLLKFPLPILAVARQLLISGCSCIHLDGEGNTEPVNLVPSLALWERTFGINIKDANAAQSYNPRLLADQIIASSSGVKKVGFIGLGAMGFGMAVHLLRSNFCVIGYDVYAPTLSRFADAGGLIGNSPTDVSRDIDVLIVMVANEAQAESVLYGFAGSVPVLPVGTTIILSSTVSPGFVTRLEQRLQGEERDLKLVDAPVSGGVKRAADGTLTIMASGTEDALKCAGSLLSALSENLYIIKGGCGAGSSVKMINQLLAGVHIATAAEAMAFGVRMGLNARLLFEVIMNSDGSSWMFGNRVPHMLDNDYTPYSAIDIFVKDLGIVTSEGSIMKMPLYVSAIAHQQFLSGSASGWGRLDDAAVVKVYEALTGVKVDGRLPVLKKADTIRSLSAEWPEDPIECIQALQKVSETVLVVLDDDPTGTQTVHDVEVLTEWSVESLIEQFSKKPACFFILTNSRSLNSERATLLTKDICRNVDVAAKSVQDIRYTIVLRGDSTLRGHFPEEADAAVSVLGDMDAWVICPFFFQGGRYTINDIHYVAESERLVPAGETEFSKDAAFGYKASNLREWVEEKTKGRIKARNIASVSLNLLRKGGPSAVCEHLCSLPKGSICIVNAASERDISVFAAGMIQAEIRGKRFLCRTAASFVSARIGLKHKASISAKDLGINSQKVGGLVVVGSYVPKSTKQVAELKLQAGHAIKCIEVSVPKLSMKSLTERQEEINQAAEMADSLLRSGKDTLIMTSRELVKGKSAQESLEINSKISSALVTIVRLINTRPRYILAKGGITSSDIATEALEAKRALVMGQVLPGVPLWQLGPESRHPGLPYIVFPGNVGENGALVEVVKNWARPRRDILTKDILISAEKGGYAVGAFNVYNLEGIEAIIAAAEAERSPAILQIHPGSLKLSGLPLISSCITAAEEANVPVSVHFDHGTSKLEMLEALDLGFDSVMVDGSQLPYKENLQYTKHISLLAHSRNIMVEAELGRLSGTEDDLTVEDYEARLTDISQALEFIDKTGIDALAVCIGNVHGKYPANGPQLRLDLLKDLRALTLDKGVFLVLHGASGLSRELVKECIDLGVRKFNVNTEVRNAYLESLKKPQKDLVDVMESAKTAMKEVVAEKMRLFGSAGKA